ncbi:MAG: MFS transporter [Candidatus Krumholzibacteria bacterium]|nr:MFS transporter [Candidatus Krumholzibacteria bacterium]
MNQQTAKQLPIAFFTMFWAAQAVSLFGDRLNNFSLMAIINNFSDNPSMTLAKLYLAMTLPLFLLAPIIGALVDRLNKCWILVCTDLCRAALACMIPMLFIKTNDFFPVMAIVFLLSTGNLFFLPAKSALIPELVSREQLLKVNSILWAAGIAGVVGGFLGGGIIYDFFSWPACFYLDGVSYLISASLIFGIALHGMRNRVAEPSKKTYHPDLLKALLEGIHAIRTSPQLLRPLGVQSLLFVGGGGFSVLVLPMIKEVSPPGSSLPLSASGLSLGLGMGAGSLVSSRLKLGTEAKERFEAAFFAVVLPATLAIGVGHGIKAILVGAFLAGLAASPLLVIAESELQREIQESMRGRVFAFREIITKSFFIASSFLFSWLAGFTGKNVLVLALGLFLACAGILWITMVSRRAKSRIDGDSGGQDADH